MSVARVAAKVSQRGRVRALMRQAMVLPEALGPALALQ